MLKLRARRLYFYGLMVACICTVACSDNAKNALKSELNSTNFNLVDPANDWTYAGGIVVYDTHNSKAGATFYGLPPGVSKPETVPATAVWGQDKINSSFTLQALVSGIGSLVKGGLGVNHSNQITLAQINASGTRVEHPETILTNPAVSAQIKTWLAGGRYSVYLVNTALDTTSLSVTTTSSTGITAAFGSSLPQCQKPASGNTTGGSTGGTGGNTGGTTTGDTTGATSSGSRAGASKPAGNSAGGTNGSSSSGPTGTLQACKNDDSTFSLSTQTPLVFATLTNAVTLQSGGDLQLVPVSETVTGGGERGKAVPTQAATLSGKWKQSAWPNP